MAFNTKGKVRSIESKNTESEINTNEVKTFSAKEIEFIALKLRQADYKGTEFETFYVIMKKLSEYNK